MKKPAFFFTALLLILNLFLSNGFAQDYTQWRLPDSAKARIGKGKIKDVKFSPDNTQLAVATTIGVWLYDAQTGAEIALLKEHRLGHRTANTLAFSPDGKTLASGLWPYSGPIQLWDITTGEKSATLGVGIGTIKAMTFSGDGSLLFCGHLPRDAKIKINAWEIATGREVVSFSGSQKSRSGLNTPLVISQDARFMVGATDNIVRIWDVDKKKLHRTLKKDAGVPDRSSLAQALAFSPDGKTLASGRTALRLWDVETGNELVKLPEQPRVVGTLAFSPNGEILATGNYAGTILLWNLPTQNYLFPAALAHGTLPVLSFAFTTDSQTLASGGADGTIRGWDLTSKNQHLMIQGHTGNVRGLQFLENGKTLFSCGTDGTFRYWHSETGKERLIPTEQKWYVFSAALSKDGKMIASGNVDGLVRLWDTASHTIIATLTGHTHGSVIRFLQFSEDGKTLGSASFRGEAIVWDVPNRKQLHFLPGDHSTNVRPSIFAFSSDLKKIAFIGSGKKIQLWDISADKVYTLKRDLSITNVFANRDFRALAFSPDGRTLASGNWSGDIHLWDTETHRRLTGVIEANGTIDALKFSPDGRTLAKGGSLGFVELWDVETRTQIWWNHSAHADSVTHFAFTPDSKTFVSGSDDGTMLLWDPKNIRHKDR